ncbi:50S ribosomal protein L3 [Candidatus Woesearchaeota archaeon]|nr:50S ribosomal protein L3 [Candidatus Woesearchaeota archaeon]MCF7901662.1 50S ribosomal protein L3 [Candidatus Woesearchaeota archaeon]MCF8013336.1 50S ribosomal protein L3 [Candidatus Woesearchaeota archaeon]
MGKTGKPRSGSMGVWPRKRSVRPYAKVRAKASVKEAKLLSFPAYKAGMTHVMAVGSDKNKRTAKLNTAVSVTILECPPIRLASLRLYKETSNGSVVVSQLNFKTEKELTRKLPVVKKGKLSTTDDLAKLNSDDYSDVTVQVYTQPKQTSIKKTPELFEISLGGKVADKIEWVKAHLDSQIPITEVFKEGQFVDSHSITKGKGFQGPVKRFGIGLTSHKAEKARRNPGSLGGWKGQAHVMYRVPHAGQTGYHQRTQFNNSILKISEKPEEVNPKGGLVNFGNVKSSYLLIRGTIPGPKKRLITLTEPVRLNGKKPEFTPDSIKQIITDSKQGR